MRELTLDEKISIKGKLARKGLTRLPRLDMKQAVLFWNICYYSSIKYFYLIPDKIRK